MKKSNPYLYKLLRPLFVGIFMGIFHPQIVNREYIADEGAVVVAGNHKHALDPVLVIASTKRVVHTLAKSELHDGMFGWFFRAIGTIPVVLDAKHNGAAFKAAIEYLNDGYMINLSPEAARNFSNDFMLPFKPGAVVMAKRVNCKIVPYSITGDYYFRSKSLKIVFGKPLDMSELSVEEGVKLLYESIKQLMLENGGLDDWEKRKRKNNGG